MGKFGSTGSEGGGGSRAARGGAQSSGPLEKWCGSLEGGRQKTVGLSAARKNVAGSGCRSEKGKGELGVKDQKGMDQDCEGIPKLGGGGKRQQQHNRCRSDGTG